MNQLLNFRITRFFIVGVGTALFYFCLTYIFIRLTDMAFLSAAMAYVVAIAVAYLGHQRWTFTNQHRHAAALPRYLVTQLASIVLSGSASHFSESLFGAGPVVMSATATLVSSSASFLLARFWVFAHRSET